MKKGRSIQLFSAFIALICVAAFADDFDPRLLMDWDGERAKPKTPIIVEIKRALFSAATQDTPNPRSRKLVHATVLAGGRMIELDWSENPQVEREIERNAALTHGDLRVKVANVRGTMEFRPHKLAGKSVEVDRSPVIVVESINFELVHEHQIGRDSPRRGPNSVVP